METRPLQGRVFYFQRHSIDEIKDKLPMSNTGQVTETDVGNDGNGTTHVADGNANDFQVSGTGRTTMGGATGSNDGTYQPFHIHSYTPYTKLIITKKGEFMMSYHYGKLLETILFESKSV